ncbi:MarR family winged helix-turn-helix transcriptional regulator [Pseudonocardia acaciae]|uniref:MarR family winged helix-turn-helix transcriptional regulator n=1 Tax=Pseudonocardia acaciae TaxID=551276 RepID=UPI000684B313|nr:MarR family transcriptional regulator [Pseudonocardia acaciae]
MDPIDPAMEAEWAQACDAIYRVLKRGRGVVGRGGGGRVLSEAQVLMLESVAHRGPLPVGTIARYAGLAQPTVTRMLNTLERQEVVRRRASSQDERVVLVELTEEGRRLWEAKHAVLRDYQRDSLERFAPEERRAAVDMLRKLVAIIEDQIDER